MRRIGYISIILCVFMVQSVYSAPIVIAGSSLVSPPPFWSNSFWGMIGSIERAFPFNVISGGPYKVEELQVAAYCYAGAEGSLAQFSINLDDDGHPGESIGIFEVTGISTAQQVITTQVTQNIQLYADTNYWFVGQTSSGQVNWNLADDVFGTAAYRGSQDDWIVLSNTNVSAFAILGSQVPEPVSALMMSIGTLFIIQKRKRGQY